jgi:hypothetical protein
MDEGDEFTAAGRATQGTELRVAKRELTFRQLEAQWFSGEQEVNVKQGEDRFQRVFSFDLSSTIFM